MPRYRGLIHGTVQIVKEEGLSGIYRGLGPVVSSLSAHVPSAKGVRADWDGVSLQAARQGANSAVRFTTYGTLKVSRGFSFWQRAYQKLMF